MAIFNGFSYADIKNHVITYVGNNSTEFADYVDDLILMAEHRYFKMHDWSFTYKSGLSLAVNSSQNEYDLTTATIGYFMAAADVETIRSQDDNVYLIKLDLAQLRKLDAGMNYGSADMPPIYWAVAGDNKIHFWPSKLKTGVLKIDGKVTPSLDLTGSPIIPMRYQEAFIEYVKALALDRENDDRASVKKAEALALIRQDIQDDMRNLGDTENPRIKSLNEIYEMSSSVHPVIAGTNDAVLSARHNLSGTVTVTPTDYYLGVNSAAPVTLNLPTAAAAGSGKSFIIKDETGQAATNNITIVPVSPSLIDGQANYVIAINYESVSIVSDGSNWSII
jgi:hypothetical protein